MRPRPPLTLIGKVSHCGENIGARDGEQGRVRLGREGLAAAHGRVSEHDMWPRRRAPLLWWSGTEEDHRGDRVRRGEVRRSRVSGDDQGGPGDLRGELGEPRRSRLYRSRLKTRLDRKSTRLNSSHVSISYAVFCLIKKKLNKYIS